MDITQHVLLGGAVLLVTFTLGATIAWRLEARRPLAAPLWLLILGNVSTLALTLSIVVVGEPPTGAFRIDPAWWNAGEASIVVAALVALAIELRGYLGRGESA